MACPSEDSTVSECSMVIITTVSKTYGPSPQNKALSPNPGVDRSFPVKHGGSLGDPAPSLPTGDKAVLQAGIGYPEMSHKLVLGRNLVFLLIKGHSLLP